MPAAIQSPALPSEVLMIAETQWLFTEAELRQTPTIIAGLPLETERENRSKGVNFILQVGIMLKLPQITLATASVFLHRFYMRHPMKWPENPHGFHHYEVGATSLFLATKVEENCRKMKELVIACCRVAQKDPHKLVDEQDKEYWRWRDVILLSEDVMLEAICFDLSLEPPYKTLFEQLVFFGEGDNNRLRNAAWAFVNDSYLTMLCLLFPSRTIATSALYAAAKHCGVSFPDDEQGRPWWHIIGVDLEEIRRACNYMASVYEGTASKGGKEGGMYERTSELGDGRGDKTRIAGPTGEGFQSPAGGIVNGSAASPVTVEAGGKRTFEERAEPLSEPTTNGASHQLDSDLPLQDGNADRRKRQRMADDTAPSDASTGPPDGAINATVLHDGNTSRDPHSSSIPSQLNGIYVHESGLSDSGGLVSPKLDDVSEEGEVEA